MRVSLLVLLVAACGDNAAGLDARPVADAAIDSPPDAFVDTLFTTGLCVDRACTQVSPGIYTYTPRFPLYADAATKRRWMYLPPGSTIDTTDMDHWVFPVGTKFWKEFTSETSVRIETRFIMRVGSGGTPADWRYTSYQWNATDTDAVAVPQGVVNANGTTHDIPSRSQCKNCHENLQPTRILGFGAIQLDATTATAGELDLDHVVANGWLTANPPGASSPHYPLPGTATDHAALGYLHANCGHCHNPTSDVFISSGVPMVLRLGVGTLNSVTATPTYMTTVNQNPTQNIGAGTKIIVPHDPGIGGIGGPSSVLLIRFESLDPAIWMPKLGHKIPDPAGKTALETWISGLN